jgi:hypothetical protein
MKRIAKLLLIGALASSFCVACEDAGMIGQTEQTEQPGNKQSQDPEQKPEPEPETDPNTYVTEHYLIYNQIESDIVVELHSGEVFTIKPGETREIESYEICHIPGTALSRSMYTVDRAVMKIDGVIVPEFIWLHEYWSSPERRDGEDDYHYSLTITLPVTDELVEDVVQRQASIIHVLTDYRIVNQIESDIDVIDKYSGKVITIKPGDMQEVDNAESYIERDNLIIRALGR